MAAKSATMKTQDQNTCLALRLDAEEATLWWWLGFEDDSQVQRGAELEQILQINDAIVKYITYYTLQQHGAHSHKFTHFAGEGRTCRRLTLHSRAFTEHSLSLGRGGPGGCRF